MPWNFDAPQLNKIWMEELAPNQGKYPLLDWYAKSWVGHFHVLWGCKMRYDAISRRILDDQQNLIATQRFFFFPWVGANSSIQTNKGSSFAANRRRRRIIESETIMHAYFISACTVQKMVTYQNGAGMVKADWLISDI